MGKLLNYVYDLIEIEHEQVRIWCLVKFPSEAILHVFPFFLIKIGMLYSENPFLLS